jgi:signal recognition particle receptor subunit beta
VNCFDNSRTYEPAEVQFALNLDPGVPVIMCDARRRDSAKEALIALVEHAMKTAWGND